MDENQDETLYSEVGLPEFTTVARKTKNNGDVLYVLRPKERPKACEVCGSTSVHVHKTTRRNVVDFDMSGHRVWLTVEGRSYRCPDCGNLIRMSYPSLHGRMTARLVEAIQQDALRHTFSDTARRFHTTTTTVKSLFEEYADERLDGRPLSSPAALGMNEIRLEGSNRGVFVSFDKGEAHVLELVEESSLDSVMNTLSSMDRLENLRIVIIDMQWPYREAVRRVFGDDMPVVIDRFHVIKNLMKSLDAVRAQICKQIRGKDRRTLKRNRYLLLRNNDDLTVRQGADLAQLLETFPEFEGVYLLKEAFRDIYASARSSDEARAMFADWRRECERVGNGAYDGFVKTVEAWEDEIFAYFDFPDFAMMNVRAESLNRSIRAIARAGRGYSFDVLRKKVLLTRYVYEPEERFSFADFDE